MGKMKERDINRRNAARELIGQFKERVLGQPVLDCHEEGDNIATCFICFALGAGMTLDDARAACQDAGRFLGHSNVPTECGTQAHRITRDKNADEIGRIMRKG